MGKTRRDKGPVHVDLHDKPDYSKDRRHKWQPAWSKTDDLYDLPDGKKRKVAK